MSNRNLVLAALALIVGVVASVAWYVAGDVAARRAEQDERRPPIASPELMHGATSSLDRARAEAFARRGLALPQDCSCRDSRRS